ncbi:hypothetical protein CASFOL_035395 [Castilleja foliolosa]|uniref:F-box domain-containing protein n=1 Tax=Castilleja foliolosa TaxID=1961234 RepID=A0ABD3BSP4_9LAMI
MGTNCYRIVNSVEKLEQVLGQSRKMTSRNKRPIDRISALPDCLIIHILSLLEVKQSAITGLLSKRWQFLWTRSPRLIFREKRLWLEPPEVQDFVSWVNKTLVICGQNDLDTFELEFPYSESYSPDVNVWVGLAVINKAKQVSLLLSSFLDELYTLPRTMFQSAYLKRLKLQGCVVAPMGTIEWPSLTELRIEDSILQQHVMDKMLSGCPVLHCLVLKNCWGFNRLEVSSKSLYELWVSGPEEGDANEHLLQLSAPYLHTLYVALFPVLRKLSLENTSSLVKATIEFLGCGERNNAEVISNAKELLEKIRHVKVVDLRYSYVKVLSLLAMNDYRFPQSARTCLTVEVPTEECSIHFLVGLLESSPDLETLVIEGSHSDWEPYTSIDSKIGLDCDLLHLKSIVIKDFTSPNPTFAGEPMLTLARILLNKAPKLEKMVIHNKRFTSSSLFAGTESFKIAQKLLSYPNSSNAVILLK